MTIECNNYIGGTWTGSSSATYLESHNPADGSVVARAPRSNVDDIRQAITSAKEAFEGNVWGDSPNLRAKALLKLTKLTEENSEELAKLVTLETGQPISDSRKEMQICIDHLEYHGWPRS